MNNPGFGMCICFVLDLVADLLNISTGHLFMYAGLICLFQIIVTKAVADGINQFNKPEGQ